MELLLEKQEEEKEFFVPIKDMFDSLGDLRDNAYGVASQMRVASVPLKVLVDRVMRLMSEQETLAVSRSKLYNKS